MAVPLITDVFGTGATISATELLVPAAYFTEQGLTISSTTDAQALVVAQMLNMATVLTEIARGQDLVNRTVTVTYAGQDLVSQSGNNYQRDVWSVVAYKATPINPVNPNQY